MNDLVEREDPSLFSFCCVWRVNLTSSEPIDAAMWRGVERLVSPRLTWAPDWSRSWIARRLLDSTAACKAVTLVTGSGWSGGNPRTTCHGIFITAGILPSLWPAKRYLCKVSGSLSEAALMNVWVSRTARIDEVDFRSLLDGPRNRSRRR